jgi:NYN domain
LLKPGQTLAGVKYFTASVRNDPAALARQNAYLGALGAATSVTAFRDRFQQKQTTYRSCGASRTTYEEKETDVNIAVILVEDAALGYYDTASVVSADSDQCPAVGRRSAYVPAGTTSWSSRLMGTPTICGKPPARRSLSAIPSSEMCSYPPTVTDGRGTSYTRPTTLK